MEAIEADFGRIEAFKEEMIRLSSELKSLSFKEAMNETGMLKNVWKEIPAEELGAKTVSVIERIGTEADEIEGIVNDLEVSSQILFGTEMYNRGVGLIRRYL